MEAKLLNVGSEHENTSTFLYLHSYMNFRGGKHNIFRQYTDMKYYNSKALFVFISSLCITEVCYVFVYGHL